MAYEYTDEQRDHLVINRFNDGNAVFAVNGYAVTVPADALPKLIAFLGGSKAEEEQKAYDPPPAHYQGEGVTPWHIWEAFGLDPWQANVIKYVLRAGKKPGEEAASDYEKAVHYLSYLIDRAERGS